MGKRQVPRPDAASESVLHGVRRLNSLVLILEGMNCDDGAEDLLLQTKKSFKFTWPWKRNKRAITTRHAWWDPRERGHARDEGKLLISSAYIVEY